MSLIERFDRNACGRDFVIGDIHGCFDDVRTILLSVDFDESKDRLFSVGDLVDRGPQSREAVDWIEKPWFHAVLGNHEQMAIDHAGGNSSIGMYRGNGGSWFIDLARDEQEAIASAFRQLPILIEVETANGRIGIVHADPVYRDWLTLVERVGSEHVQNAAVWSRDRIQSGDTLPVNGIDAVIVGHTILSGVQRLGNVIYIDTGAVAGKSLTMLELGESPLVHSLPTKWQIAA